VKVIKRDLTRFERITLAASTLNVISDEEARRWISCAIQSITDYEQGKATPSLRTLAKLVRTLDARPIISGDPRTRTVRFSWWIREPAGLAHAFPALVLLASARVVHELRRCLNCTHWFYPRRKRDRDCSTRCAQKRQARLRKTPREKRRLALGMRVYRIRNWVKQECEGAAGILQGEALEARKRQIEEEGERRIKAAMLRPVRRRKSRGTQA
jgi:hypothetical protein